MVGDVVNIGAAITNVQVHSIGHTAVSLASTTPVNINVGTMVSFSSSTFNVFESASDNDEKLLLVILLHIGQNASAGGANDVIDLGQNSW